VFERARERTQGSPLGWIDALAARVGEPRDEVARVISAVTEVQRPPTPAAEIEELRLVKRLNDWLKKLA
jgi:hypothetical protein